MTEHKIAGLSLLMLFVIVFGGIVLVTLTQEDSKQLEKTIANMSNSEIAGMATFSGAITSLEKERILTQDWKLSPLIVAEAKGRAEYLVISKDVQDMCLTALARSPSLTLRFHKDCKDLIAQLRRG